MIQLRSRNDGSIEVSNREHVVKLTTTSVILGEQRFSEPGEYEVEGIEIIYGTQAVLLIWEKLQLVYLFNAAKPLSFEKSQFAPCNVLLFGDSVGELDKQNVNELLETYDPNIIGFAPTLDIKAIQDSLKIEDRDGLKLTEATLPTEGRELYRLI